MYVSRLLEKGDSSGGVKTDGLKLLLQPFTLSEYWFSAELSISSPTKVSACAAAASPRQHW